VSVYLVLYHDDQQKSLFEHMDAEEEFSEFSRDICSAVIDSGSRVLSSKAITPQGSTNSKDQDQVCRYLMIEAGDIEEAIEISKNAPILRHGGHAEVLELSMASY
jgi:hypothetical protein